MSNPTYGGAYAFGKTKTKTTVIEGRARKTVGHQKPRCEWTVLLPGHHPGYISWEQYERHQAMLAADAHMKSGMQPKAGRGGCTFSGLRVERAVAGEVLRAIGGNVVEASVEAAGKMRRHFQEQRRAVELEREQARYEDNLAARRYAAVDPDQRLVAAELEARWNAALQKAQELEDRLRAFEDPDKDILLSLAQDLPAVWNSPGIAASLKQRIVRILVEEVVVDVDEEKQEVVLLIHWAGGRHSELRVSKRGTDRQRRRTRSP